ncbi:MAG TPA: hypothetical protein VLF79_04565 [Candidatus Saccharimonadales bacterium]|nr:hypothetical protein [Candidatus Saccharimonadales bacterium]
MTKAESKFYTRLSKYVGSSHFYRLVIGILIVQAAWIALTGRYPMAFDEDFHLGIIRLYAHHWLPIWSGQPPGADMFGAVARDPSYLYQYILSWPYRLIALFTNDQNLQVIILRAINIALFAYGVILFKRLLEKTKASNSVINISILLFVLIPIVPLLAAQINYDNLFLPVTAFILLKTWEFKDRLNSSNKIDIKALMSLIIFCMLASLVKYAFLPIFIAIIIYILFSLWKNNRSLKGIFNKTRSAWLKLDRWWRIGLALTFIVTSLLFAERYIINIIRYHSPVPNCNKILSVSACSKYGPWIRDYTFENNKVEVSRSPVIYTKQWLYGMWFRSYFAVDGPSTDFQTRRPLPVPSYSAIFFTVLAFIAAIAKRKTLYRKYNGQLISFLLGVAFIYVATLWVDEYLAFLRTTQPVAINGRYLIPVILPVIMVGSLAISELLKNYQILKVIMVSTAIFCSIWGGGALTYILRSNDQWYWRNQTVYDINHAVNNLMGPITPGYK